jgi:hypothetical protein
VPNPDRETENGAKSPVYAADINRASPANGKLKERKTPEGSNQAAAHRRRRRWRTGRRRAVGGEGNGSDSCGGDGGGGGNLSSRSCGGKDGADGDLSCSSCSSARSAAATARCRRGQCSVVPAATASRHAAGTGRHDRGTWRQRVHAPGQHHARVVGGGSDLAHATGTLGARHRSGLGLEPGGLAEGGAGASGQSSARRTRHFQCVTLGSHVSIIRPILT